MITIAQSIHGCPTFAASHLLFFTVPVVALLLANLAIRKGASVRHAVVAGLLAFVVGAYFAAALAALVLAYKVAGVLVLALFSNAAAWLLYAATRRPLARGVALVAVGVATAAAFVVPFAPVCL